jgi:endoglucanase
MDEDQFSFFQRLVESTGPSGYEEQTQQIWRERVRAAADAITTDSLGNSIAVLNASGRPRVMFDAHIDEIGFIIKYIDDNGFLYFSGIGGFDASTLAGNRVRILTKNGPVLGVFGRKPVHLIEQDERKKAPELKNMWIDMGAASRAEAEKLISIGDAGGRAHGLDRLQGRLVASAALDDRVGAYIVAETFRAVADKKPQVAVHAASSVQEEIGLRGARVSSYQTEAEIGIAVEVTWTSDHPQTSKTELGDVRVGAGPVLTRGPNTNPRIFERLVEAAQSEGAPYQVEAQPRGTGTDQNVMQLSRSGMATGLLSVPTRYLHTASEILSLDDVDASVAILTRFINQLDSEVDLTP